MGNCLHPDTPCQLLCSANQTVINIVMYNCDCNFKHSHVQLYTLVFSNKARFSHTSTVAVTRLHSCYGKKYAYASRASCFYIEINIFEHF